MANYLDANPEDADFIANLRLHSGFVPIARKGQFVASINPHRLVDAIVPDSLSAEDYIVGMELLGYRFAAVEQHDGTVLLATINPDLGDELPPLPRAWHDYAMDLMRAFSRRDRDAELLDFVRERDGVERWSGVRVREDRRPTGLSAAEHSMEPSR